MLLSFSLSLFCIWNYLIPSEFKIYNLLGNELVSLVNEEKPAGEYEINFNGNNLTGGIYICRLNVKGEKNYEITHKLVM